MKRSVLTALAASVIAVLSLGFIVASPLPAGAATALTLTVTPSTTVTFGNETTLVFSGSINNILAGPKTVTVQAAGVATPVCSFTLSADTGQCSMSSATQLPPSTTPYSVTASYPGDGVVPPLTSSPVLVTVDQLATTTSLSISPTTSLTYGQESTLTFTSTVTPQITPVPTGMIDVEAGSTVVCAITLPATTCSSNDDPVSVSASPAAITATYLGDTNYATSTSAPENLTIAQATSSTTLSPVAPSSVVYGDESTLQLTATVAPQFGGTPTGTIAVATGATTLCTITLPATSCVPLSGVLLSPGTYDLTATYSGDANVAASLPSNSEPLTVTAGNTTTTLQVTPSNVTTYGDESSLTFAAAVISSGSPTGTISVEVGSTVLCSFDAAASPSTCTAANDKLPASSAPYSVVASYSGDTNFTPSSSDPQPVTVQQDPTTTTLSFAQSTVASGDEASVTFTATLSPTFTGFTTGPTGTINVLANGIPICSVDVTSATQCSTGNFQLPPSASAYNITASYGGDSDFVSSTTATSQSLIVTEDPTTTSLSFAQSTVALGNESSVTFTATVSPTFTGFTNVPTGTITVLADGSSICTINVSIATQCTTADDELSPSVTPYDMTATYGGDTNFATSTTATSQPLTVTEDPTTTTLSFAPSSVAFGSESSVTFTATVGPTFTNVSSGPTGIINVLANGSSICMINVATATQCTTSGTELAPSGTPYNMTASYGGDANFAPSTTATSQPLTVTAVATSTTLALSSATVTYGNEGSVTFTATVTPAKTGGPAPSGTVTVTEGKVTLCAFDVSSATSCSIQNDPTLLDASTTAYSVVATYGGDANYGGSFSSPSSLTVTQASTTTVLAPSATTVTYGDEQSVTFTVTVTPQFPSNPSGTVTVASGTTTLCTIHLPATSCNTSNGAQTNPLDSSPAPPPTYPLTAIYNGDTNFTTSSDTSQTLTVTQATTSVSFSVAPSSAAYGDESAVLFTATVSPQFPGSVPSGMIDIASGSTPLCTIALPATTCRTPNNSTGNDALAPAPTPYSVTATYVGDTNFIGSTPAASNLTITGGTSTTALSLAPASVTYGDETTAAFTITVAPVNPLAGTPTGSATVATGSTTLCMVTLSGGTGTCSVLPAQAAMLGASGTPYQVTAAYAPDTNKFTPSQSAPSGLTVGKDPTATNLAVSPAAVTYGSEGSVGFTVSVVPTFAGTPTGQVVVSAGSTTLCTIQLANATSCSPTQQAALGAGGYTAVASYSGGPNFSGSSGGNGLTVNQATPTSPSISNFPSGAAEEGSFAANVATSGDGTRTVTSGTPGTCTVGGDGVTVTFLIEGACTLTSQVSSGHNYTAATGNPQTFTILPGPRGYWLVGSDGGIFSFGDAHFYGSMGGTPLQRPVVGITPTHTKQGYWLVASDGGIFSFGDSNYYGSIPGVGLHPAGSGQPNSLDAPIVGMVPSTDGGGYFMVASDGGVFAFGDAKFAGSCPGIGGCAGSAVAVMPDHSGNGYWLVTSSGSIYAFGDAPFFGAPPAEGSPVVNAVASTDGRGYWILYADGTVLSFGDAAPLGDPAGYVNSFNPATSIFPTSDDLGYWVASARGDVFSYGNAPFLGSMSSTPLNGPIIAAFGF